MTYVNVTKENFRQEVLNSPIPVVADFWAVWCGYCTKLAPTLDDLVQEYNSRLKVVKINVDEEPELMAQFKVNVFPTLVLFQNGKETDRAIGAVPKADLHQWLAQNGAV